MQHDDGVLRRPTNLRGRYLLIAVAAFVLLCGGPGCHEPKAPESPARLVVGMDWQAARQAIASSGCQTYSTNQLQLMTPDGPPDPSGICVVLAGNRRVEVWPDDAHDKVASLVWVERTDRGKYSKRRWVDACHIP